MTVEVVVAHRVTGATLPPVGPDAVHAVTPAALSAFLARRARHRKGSVEALLEPPRAARADETPGLLLTFDDGFRDTLSEALPVLEAHAVPCVVFVTTGFADGALRPVEPDLARLVTERAAIRLPDGGWLPARTRAEQARAYEALRAPLRDLLPEAQRLALEALARANGWTAPAAPRAFLSWDEVRALDRHPLVTIGAHGQTHASLARAGLRRARCEIAGSKARLEEALGHRVAHFAYPYGAHTRAARALVRAAGFRFGFATEPEPVRDVARLRRSAVPRLDLARLAQERGDAA